MRILRKSRMLRFSQMLRWSVYSTTPCRNRDLIRNAAEQFDLKQAVTRSGKGEREIREIVPINGDNGEPAMYVVNYADNKGWVIVSASTDYAPILAHSDEGNFEVSNIEGNAIEVWVDETKSVIETMKTAADKEDGSFLDYNSTFNYNRQDIINIYPTNN